MESVKKRKSKVLVVDDSQESVDLLVYFLKPAGYEVLTAYDGATAIELVEKNPPDIILLDVMLPKINGYEVCERLKKNRSTFHIPIIMITALKELKDKIRALEAGADDFISKPFDNVELLTRVKSLLRIKYYHDEIIKRNKELEKQKEALIREDQLKKELTNLIVHDMKNPLFVIQGNLQMMEMSRSEYPGKNSDIHTQRIARSSRSLSRMILNLLDISRLEQKKMEIEPVPVDLNAMVRETARPFQDIPDHQSKVIRMDLKNEATTVYVDKDLFERVLDNLFNYVFQNTPEGMSIKVKTEEMKDDRVILRVIHQGTAIPEKFRKKIFLKHFQLELKKAGFKPARGLGLLFCRLAMEAQNGKIYLNDNGENRNCFVLEIPTLKSLQRQNSNP